MTDPPFNGITAAIIAAIKRKPFVYDIQDLYPDMAVAGSIVEPGLLTRIWERFHRWALRQAAQIIVLGDDMRARITDKGIDPLKISVVRSAAQIPLTSAPPATLNPEVINAIRGNFRFVLLHGGNLGFYGAWDTIIAAARQVEGDNVGFAFVGDGAERARLISLAAGATNIRFLPFFSTRDIPSVLAAPDAHIVTIKHGLEGVVVPSKTFGILAAGKPIVAVAPRESDVATMGTRHSFAITTDPSNPDDLVAAIRALAADPFRLKAMGRAAYACAGQISLANDLAKLVSVVSRIHEH